MDGNRDTLTNEDLRAKFSSQFEMVNVAITLAEHMIHDNQRYADIEGKNVIINVLKSLRSEKTLLDGESQEQLEVKK